MLGESVVFTRCGGGWAAEGAAGQAAAVEGNGGREEGHDEAAEGG